MILRPFHFSSVLVTEARWTVGRSCLRPRRRVSSPSWGWTTCRRRPEKRHSSRPHTWPYVLSAPGLMYQPHPASCTTMKAGMFWCWGLYRLSLEAALAPFIWALLLQLIAKDWAVHRVVSVLPEFRESYRPHAGCPGVFSVLCNIPVSRK